MTLRIMAPVLSVAFVLAAATSAAHSSAPSPDTELAQLVLEYEVAKKEWIEFKRNRGRNQFGRGGPGGGRGGRGFGGGGQASAPALQPILENIAKLNTTAGLKYLSKELLDPNPEIASMCAVAILKSDDKNRAKIVRRAYERGRKWTLGAKARVLDALAQTDAKDGSEFVLKMASKGKPESRLLALGSLRYRPRDDEALTLLLRALEDRVPAIRKAALRTLDAFGGKTVVSALVGHLAEEKEEQIRIDTLRLLVRLTGQNFGLEVNDWQKWWDTASATFDSDEKKEGKTVVVTPDLKYFGIEVASKRVSFLVDASRSMDWGVGRGGPGGGRGRGGPGGGGGGGGPTKISLLKKELSRVLRELPDETYVNIIAFHNTSVPWQKELQSLKGSGRDAAVRFVLGLTTGFGTNIYDTLELALEDKRVDTIFLLSDGMPYGGKYTDPDDIRREIGAINRVRGARIHCLGFGEETAFLKELAEENGGDYRAIDR